MLFAALPATESGILDHYLRGDIAGLIELMPTLPESTAGRQFLESVMEPDGLKGADLNDVFLKKYPDSPFAPFILERQCALRYTLGAIEQAKYLLKRIEKQYPDFSGLLDLRQIMVNPGSVSGSQPSNQRVEKPSRNRWAVQVGAFRNRRGAEAIAKKASAFGKVTLVEKSGGKGTITIVKVGHFASRGEAEKTARTIEKKLDVKPIVVVSQDD